MAKFLMVSSCGEGAHILHRIREEGNDVALYIKESGYRKCWDGLLPKVKKVAPDADTTVIFDFSGMGKLADDLRKKGHYVFGGSDFADQLEQDRTFGLDFMEAAGIKIPFTADFDEFSPSLVKDFLEEHGGNGKRFVFKPSGKGLGASLTYCSKDDEDLRLWVEYVDKYFGNQIDSFVLQEFVEGVVLMTEVYNGADGFDLASLNHTLEVKGFMDGCLGPATGCSGNLVWRADAGERVVKEGLLKVADKLKDSGFFGQIDLNTVVNEDGVYGLEWTPRFGYDSTPTTMAILDQEVGKLYYDAARGKPAVKLTNSIAAGVRVTIPPYPLEYYDIPELERISPNIGVPIRGLPEDEDGLSKFHFFEVMEEGDGILRHAPGTGVIACVLGASDDPRKAFDGPMELAANLIIPNKQYRTDLAEELGEMYDAAAEVNNG